MSAATNADIAAIRQLVATLPTTERGGAEQAAALLLAAVEIMVEDGLDEPDDLAWIMRQVQRIWLGTVRQSATRRKEMS